MAQAASSTMSTIAATPTGRTLSGSLIFGRAGERWQRVTTNCWTIFSSSGLPRRRRFRAWRHEHVAMVFHFSVTSPSALDRMLEADPKERITAEQALRHPYFWGNAQVGIVHYMLPALNCVTQSASCTLSYLFFPCRQLLGFFMDVSDRVEKEKADSPLVLALEENAQHIVGVDWRQNIGVLWRGAYLFFSSCPHLPNTNRH